MNEFMMNASMVSPPVSPDDEPEPIGFSRFAFWLAEDERQGEDIDCEQIYLCEYCDEQEFIKRHPYDNIRLVFLSAVQPAELHDKIYCENCGACATPDCDCHI